jgi:hypothetical protein
MTEPLLSVQMIGVHQAAMVFLARSTAEGQTLLGADANVLRGGVWWRRSSMNPMHGGAAG